MIKRSKGFHQVAYYLSRFGHLEGNKQYPPIRLGTKNWNEAYRSFYDSLGDTRELVSFERSMKLARDAFDSHIPESIRAGWKDENGNPSPLGVDAKEVFTKCSTLSEKEIWGRVERYFDRQDEKIANEFSSIITIQNSENTGEGRTEGNKKVATIIKYERSPKLRKEAVEIHGLKCMACGFDFEEKYGKWGRGFIEVHHIVPLSELAKRGEVKINPMSDLIVLCSNCHRMVHRKHNICLSLDELKDKVLG